MTTLTDCLPKDPTDTAPEMGVPTATVRDAITRLDAHKRFVQRMHDAAEHATLDSEVVTQLTLAMGRLAADLAAIPDGGT